MKVVKKAEKPKRTPRVYREEEYTEIYASSTMKVVMRNSLAIGDFPSFNLEQEKLFGIALANAHTKGAFYYYRCELKKLAEMIGYDSSSTSKLAEALDKSVKSGNSDETVSKLIHSYVGVSDGEKKVTYLPVFKEISIEKDGNELVLYFRLSDELKPFVLKHDGDSCVLALDLFTKSRSPYSIRLGRALSALTMKGETKEVSFNKEEVAKILQLPDTYKDNYYETKRTILLRAIREVNELENGIYISDFDRIGDGRRYAGIKFTVEKD